MRFDKNQFVRQLISEVSKKRDSVMKAVDFETHKKEWINELKRQRRLKEEKGGSD